MAGEKQKFIRVRGKVVPVKNKGKKNQPAAQKPKRAIKKSAAKKSPPKFKLTNSAEKSGILDNKKSPAKRPSLLELINQRKTSV